MTWRQRAFDPEFLRQLDTLALGIRRAMPLRRGQRSVGRAQGTGIELESFREYVEGDDLRFLDWNSMARLDDLLTKSYRVEREIEVNILIDGSASMGQPVEDDKFGFAMALASALAYIALGENDPVRLLCFSGARSHRPLETTRFFRRRESYLELRPFVNDSRCGGAPALDAAVTSLLEQQRTPGQAIVISDFLVPVPQYRRALSELQAGRFEVKVLQVVGQREVTMDFPLGSWRLRDAESGEIREVAFTRDSIANCRDRFERMRLELRGYCADNGINYAQALGTERLEHIITRELPRLGLVR